MPSHSILAIANEFLKRESLHQMKVQKLVYIAHGWTLAITGEPLVADIIEAWDNGPVSPLLYREYRYGSFVSGGLLVGPGGVAATADLSAKEQGIIDAVWKRYGRYSAQELSDLTHQIGTPWNNAYSVTTRNVRISNDDIGAHYRELGRAGRSN